MNFEFSEESQMLRDQAREFLRDKCSPQLARDVIEGKITFATSLWQEMATMGWLGAVVPEAYGGGGLDYEVLCVLAEEIGRAVAPVPFGSSICLAAEAILAVGNDTQKRRLLPAIADGSSIGCFALTDGMNPPNAQGIKLVAKESILTGVKWPVTDGMIANFAIVAARDTYGIGLYHVDLAQPCVARTSIPAFDSLGANAKIQFEAAGAERLGDPIDAWPLIEQLLDRAAILTAFEQIGGAEAALYMARDYTMGRYAFGRPLASFQAIKHKLADVFVELEIARANAYYGAWALSRDEELPLAAATARVAAIEAARIATKENIQAHGGVGFTWEFDCHLYYRRAKSLALSLGGSSYWINRVADRLEAANAAGGLAGGF